MNDSKLLRRCDNYIEAESLRTRLDAAGILAVINGADGHIALSYVGTALGGVKLEVAPEDYDRAARLLSEDSSRAAQLGDWSCGRCREKNEATFEVCWACQKVRDDGDLPPTESDDDDSRVGPTFDPDFERQNLRQADEQNPYRAVLLEGAAAVDGVEYAIGAEFEPVIRRAYIGAVIGLFLLPPLINLYSLYLLVFSGASRLIRMPRYRNRLVIAWLINCASIALWSIVCWQMGMFVPFAFF